MSLESLAKVASALGCDLVYALVPRKPLAQSYNERDAVHWSIDV